MARLTIEAQGVGVAAERLRALGDRVEEGFSPELQDALNSLVLTYQQDHYRNATGPDGPWPELHWLTVKIRARFGHGAKKVMVRGGDLYASITTLFSGVKEIFVGTNLRYARVVHDGGTVTDERGVTRTVQAFPWAYLTPEEEGDLVDTIALSYEESFAGA